MRFIDVFISAGDAVLLVCRINNYDNKTINRDRIGQDNQ